MFQAGTTVINQSGLFIYSGTPGPGNPPVAWLGDGPAADPYGNALVTALAGFQSPGVATTYFDPSGELVFANASATQGAVISQAGGGTLQLQSPVASGLDIAAVARLIAKSASLNGGAVLELDANTAFVSAGGTITSPSIIITDTWHSISLDAGWTAGSPAPSYRLLPTGDLQLTGVATHAAITTETALNSGTPLPAAYRPLTNKNYQANRAGGTAGAQVKTTGVVFAEPNGVSNTSVDITGIVPLNL